MDAALADGMTGSAFLAYARKLARSRYNGTALTAREVSQVDAAVEVFGPEYFYMDGELFA